MLKTLGEISWESDFTAILEKPEGNRLAGQDSGLKDSIDAFVDNLCWKQEEDSGSIFDLVEFSLAFNTLIMASFWVGSRSEPVPVHADVGKTNLTHGPFVLMYLRTQCWWYLL